MKFKNKRRVYAIWVPVDCYTFVKYKLLRDFNIVIETDDSIYPSVFYQVYLIIESRCKEYSIDFYPMQLSFENDSIFSDKINDLITYRNEIEFFWLLRSFGSSIEQNALIEKRIMNEYYQRIDKYYNSFENYSSVSVCTNCFSYIRTVDFNKFRVLMSCRCGMNGKELFKNEILPNEFGGMIGNPFLRENLYI